MQPCPPGCGPHCSHPDLACVCRSPAWCMPSRWAGSSLAGPGTPPLPSMTCGPRRTPTLCWDVTRCTCLLPSWPCLATPSPTTHLLSTCPARRRWAWCWGGGLYSSSQPCTPGSSLSPQRLAWEQQEPAERKLNFLPRKFPSLRAVPAYGRFIQERFERCLDLYLCPRQRKMRVCGAAGHLGRGRGTMGRDGSRVTTCSPAPGECGP